MQNPGPIENRRVHKAACIMFAPLTAAELLDSMEQLASEAARLAHLKRHYGRCAKRNAQEEPARATAACQEEEVRLHRTSKGALHAGDVEALWWAGQTEQYRTWELAFHQKD